MSVSAACCTAPAVLSNYQPTGTVFHLDGMEVYEAEGAKDATTAVIVLPDIFGLSPQVKQVRC